MAGLILLQKTSRKKLADRHAARQELQDHVSLETWILAAKGDRACRAGADGRA